MLLEPLFDASLNSFSIDANGVDTFEITGTKTESSSVWSFDSQQSGAADITYYDAEGDEVTGDFVPSPLPPSNPDSLTVTVDFTLAETAVSAVLRIGLYSYKYQNATIYTINITK